MLSETQTAHKKNKQKEDMLNQIKGLVGGWLCWMALSALVILYNGYIFNQNTLIISALRHHSTQLSAASCFHGPYLLSFNGHLVEAIKAGRTISHRIPHTL